MFNTIISFIREVHGIKEGFIPLHAPVFSGREKNYILDCIDSTFVSSVGRYVDRFEKMMAEYTGAGHAIATVNGTAALHVALLLAGVKPQDEVITQAVSFVATVNAISYCGAEPVFLDSDRNTLGLSPEALAAFLGKNGEQRADGCTYNKSTGRKITACVPMHVFGHAVRIDRIQAICEEYNITLVEDAAESLGSSYRGRHTGTFGKLGIVSFNGNKIITTGGGGMILTDDDELGRLAKHLTTTAKVDHPWEYLHDRVGYNYRMPNINAALGCAQLEQLDSKLNRKRKLAETYSDFFHKNKNISFVTEPEGCRSNYWLNAILLESREERDEFLQISNADGVMTRPLWKLLPELPMFQHCQSDGLENARWLQERIVNIPSSVIDV
jgi:aminotransferase in exopolysaccharide biosynthesis